MIQLCEYIEYQYYVSAYYNLKRLSLGPKYGAYDTWVYDGQFRVI